MRLLIISHVSHFRHADGYHAYTPYAREIEIWADLFAEVVIAAPCRDERPPANTCRINRPNVRVAPQLEVGGTTWRHKIGICLALLPLIITLSREMRKADAIHVRCPGNLGLLGALLAPLFSRRLVAKFAGDWNGSAHEEWTVQLQRVILGSGWWRGPVTVYGRKPEQRPHIVDFFSSMLTAKQLSRARVISTIKQLKPPFRVIYTGRLTRSKNIDVLLRAVATLRADRVPITATIVGCGPERDSLEMLSRDLKIADHVHFAGAVSPEGVLRHLEKSDVFVLASSTEGWPKAMTEAMAFGLICIGSNLGLIPTILGDGRGLTVPPRDVPALSEALRSIICAPENCEGMRARASEWAQRFSLESMRNELRALLVRSWNLGDVNFPQRYKATLVE